MSKQVGIVPIIIMLQLFLESKKGVLEQGHARYNQH